jgi:5-methylcytosine-specific restriction endonuclease McrA
MEETNQLSWHQRNPEKSRIIWKRWADKNRAYLSERSRQHRKLNPEKIKAARKRYNDGHKEQLSLKNKEWMIKNSARRKEYMRKWSKDNNHRRKSYDTKSRALRRVRESVAGVNDPYVLTLVSKWKRESVFICYYCSYQCFRTQLHIDHVIPISKGGKHTVANIAKACSHCNQSKRDKMPSEFAVMGQMFLNL